MYLSVLSSFGLNYASSPLFFELGCEVAYPVGEGVMAGVMTCLWAIVGAIFLFVFFIKDIGKKHFAFDVLCQEKFHVKRI